MNLYRLDPRLDGTDAPLDVTIKPYGAGFGAYFIVADGEHHLIALGRSPAEALGRARSAAGVRIDDETRHGVTRAVRDARAARERRRNPALPEPPPSRNPELDALLDELDLDLDD